MKRLALVLGVLLLVSTVIYCSKPCKIPDMNKFDMDSNVDMAEPIDMFCQVNPATELCLDFRRSDR